MRSRLLLHAKVRPNLSLFILLRYIFCFIYYFNTDWRNCFVHEIAPCANTHIIFCIFYIINKMFKSSNCECVCVKFTPPNSEYQTNRTFDLECKWSLACYTVDDSVIVHHYILILSVFFQHTIHIVSYGGNRNEPVSLSTLDRDCFIIPVHSLDRFLPAGIPVSANHVWSNRRCNKNTKNHLILQLPPPCDSLDTQQNAGPLSVLEVSDPKICTLAHLMSPLEAIDPIVESPLAHPLYKQRAIASELVTEVQQTNMAVGGMLLANMERNGNVYNRRCHFE